jgi:hypothetical protein
MIKSNYTTGMVYMFMELKGDKPLVISYLRWSSGVQKLGDSERRQLSLAEDWLNENGYEVDESYVLRDDGMSGYYSENFSERGALGQFISQVKKGEIPKGTVLIIEDFSRFSRALINIAQQRFLELINNGIRVYIAKDKKEYNAENYDLTDMIISLAKMTAAREESERKSHHLTQFWDGARQKASNNSHSDQFPVLLPSNAPDWLKKVKGQDGQKYFEQLPERIQVIKRIFELADNGGDDGLGLGSTIIVRVLEAEGIKPFKGEKKNTAKTFNDSYVLRLLKDQRLLGYLQPFINPVDESIGKRKRTAVGDPIANYFPPIIDQKLFDRVNFKIQQRKIYQGGKVSRKFTNLFTKIGKCSYCGSSMTLFAKKGSKAEGGRSSYLQCSEGTKLRKCGNRAVRYFDTFEKTIIKTLIELDLSSLFQKKSGVDNQQLLQKRNEIYELQNEQKVVEKKIVNATELLLSDPTDKDIVDARTKLKNQRSVTASKLERLNEELMSVNRKSNYRDFKDNLDVVIDSYSEEDEIATYNKRRAINTYLIDIIQYIAIDGVNQRCWIVFDLGFFKEKIKQSIVSGVDLLNTLKLDDKVIETKIPDDREMKAFGTSPISAHLKVAFNRFNNRPPTKDDVLNLRESVEIAPDELVKINNIVNLAINKNWQSLKRKSYQVLDCEMHDKLLDEAYTMPQEYNYLDKDIN